MNSRTIGTWVAAGLAAIAAPAHAASPRAASGAGLEATLDFIRDKLGQQGRIDYAGAMHDSADNTNWVNRFNVEASNVTADIASCRVGFHWRTGVDGKQGQDFDTGFRFSQLQTVALTSMEEDVNRLAAKDGHPTWTGKINPPVWVLTASTSAGERFVVDFRDRDLADRVIRAMTHAMKLCGGAKAEAF
jgi:hypothetical protein